ncbi:MAG: peptidoglycan editing factor PgeF [Deltaproteobacteria bacterium]|nr:peptidoglycan editing factor PgeF [Deltaproteobacteria bacterium]
MIFLNKKFNINYNLVFGFGDKKIDFQTKNINERFNLLKEIKLNYCIKNANDINIAELNQVHGNTVLSIEEQGIKKFSEKRELCDADGIFTSLKNYLLCIKTADCIPLLFYDKISETIGAIHCGWRGTYNGILTNAKNMLADYYNLNLENIIVIIGPGICKNCYTVKEDLYEKFINININYKNYFKARQINTKNYNYISEKFEEYLFDLKGLISDILLTLGFRKENIYNINLCNYENENYFSYRKNKTDSRFVSFIGKL